MSNFTVLKNAVSAQFSLMEGALFVSNASKDELWDTYLGSFPEGTNPIFRERTEHDCNCCKTFIRKAGNILSVIDGKLTTIWDVKVGGHYQVVVDAMHKLVLSKGIAGIFLHDEHSVGTDFNHEQSVNGVIKWEHFHQVLPNRVVVRDGTIGQKKGKAVTNFNTLKRSVTEITQDAIDITLELIEQGSLYRGEEHTSTVKTLEEVKNQYEKASDKNVYLWEKSLTLGSVSSFRNTAIGSLLVDLSEGMDLEVAVKRFESVMAPANYKRSSALVTKGMIDQAQKKVVALGIENALQRRFAVTEDITINNVLFADSSVQADMGVFDVLHKEASDKLPNLDQVAEVDIERFIKDILPRADSIELMVENNHLNNFVSLIAPNDADAESILKWNNNFTWSYNGEVTDSIRERVKRAGGDVTGVLRCSASWFNGDDLDIHLIEPCGNHIHFSRKRNYKTGGALDVDMNAHGVDSRQPVENITFPDEAGMGEGEYRLYMNNFARRDSSDGGFEVEIEFRGKIFTFNYEKHMRQNENVEVARFKYTRTNGIEFISSLPMAEASKEQWGVKTMKFLKVDMVMLSPNHWDGQKVGNKHYFFMLDGCANPNKARGFYNEFLRNDLAEHRKVFEVLSSKLKTEITDNQLSGVGFSSTQRNEVLCRVRGTFNRVVKIKF